MHKHAGRQIAILLAAPLLIALFLRIIAYSKLVGLHRMDSLFQFHAQLWLGTLGFILIGILASFLFPPTRFTPAVFITACALFIFCTTLSILPFYSFALQMGFFPTGVLNALIEHQWSIAFMNVLPVQVLISHLRAGKEA